MAHAEIPSSNPLVEELVARKIPRDTVLTNIPTAKITFTPLRFEPSEEPLRYPGGTFLFSFISLLHSPGFRSPLHKQPTPQNGDASLTHCAPENSVWSIDVNADRWAGRLVYGLSYNALYGP
ncbi:hypothetical protein CEXT_714381 [Caerostris extrusa]|uniref:Uncharacterized protein n=1 Tax=Caerostris extrusa TaxID=172846 RepID=A0AAV4U104_CAEEX|nr:hypothetical protein CEXT_714381 [Caerostris extrusa]